MDIDLVLFWMALFSAVLLLVNRRGLLWETKGFLLVAGAAVLVAVAPDRAGWAIAIGWLGLIGAPAALASLASRSTLTQAYPAAFHVATAAMLLHPDHRFRAQRALVGALAAAQGGAFDRAQTGLAALIANSFTPPDVRFTALMHARRLAGRWEAFLAEADWWSVEPDLALLGRARALAALGRADELLSLPLTWTGQPGVNADLVLMYVLTGCGAPDALQSLLRRRLRLLGAPTRALQLAMAALGAGGDAERARGVLLRLTGERDCDIARTARDVLADPPRPVMLGALQQAQLARVLAQAGAAAKDRRFPMLRAAPVTVALIGGNVAVFLVEMLRGGSENAETLRRLGALLPDAVAQRGEWWRLGAALFLHYGWVHLAVNMLSLAVIGAAAERSFGPARMLALYVASGLGSMAIIVAGAVSGVAPVDFVVGASGAIMGLIGGLCGLSIRLWRRTGSRAMLARAVWVASAVVLQSALDLATPQISFTGHLSGVTVGLIVGWVLVPRTTPAGEERAPRRRGVISAAPRSRRQLVMTALGGALALAAALALPGRRADGEEAETVSPEAPRPVPAPR